MLHYEGTISEVKADPEEEPTPSNNTVAGETLLMNNGSRDTSHSDIQKLQQQLQDIKEQVRVPSASRFVMRRFNETNNFVCAEGRTVQLLCTITIRSRKTGVYIFSRKFFLSHNNFNLSSCLVYILPITRKCCIIRLIKKIYLSHSKW